MKKIYLFLSSIIIFSIFIFTSPSASAAVIDTNGAGAENGVTQDNQIDSNDNQADLLPESYSSLDLGFCTSVKTQIGNICWAYSSVSSFESLLLKNNLFSADLSHNHLDLWGTYRDDGQGWHRNPGEAGYSYIPIGYFTSWNGPVEENSNSVKFGVTALTYLGKEDMNTVKRLIMDSGAVTANFNSISTAYSKDKCSFCLTDEISLITGHTISIVGWDDNYSNEKFDGNYVPKNNGAWLCKNSWGHNNALGGYFWISYEDYYLFNNDIFGPSFGINSIQKIGSNDYLYQNEEYGATYEFNYVDSDKVVYYNVFDFSENGNVLNKVIFESTSLGADYNVYYVPVSSEGVPVSNRLRWTKLYSDKISYNGYICCDIEDMVLSQTKGAIAVEIDTTAVNSNMDTETPVQNGVGVSEWLRNRESSQMIFSQICEKGKSFVWIDDTTVDIKDFYRDKLGDEIGGTLVIKAVTNGSFNTKISGDTDFSGEVDINDATLIQKYLVDRVTNLGDDQIFNADFNKDGTVDINDVTAIQKRLAMAE